MSQTFDIELPKEAPAIIARLRDKPGLSAALARTMDKQNQLTIAKIQKSYMSFPKGGKSTLEGTRVQSNRLRSSARATKTLITGNGLLSTLGSNVVYAATQEFGIDDTVTVPAHTRRPTGMAKKRALPTVNIAVKSYTMHMKLPARQMFQKGIKDRKGDYGPALLDTMVRFEAKGES